MQNLMMKDERNMEEADFLSLDVEGAEEFVLKAIFLILNFFL